MRNIAVFQLGSGPDATLIPLISEGGAHSEELAASMLGELGFDPNHVTAIYSEREPCTLRATCRDLRAMFPNAEVRGRV